MAKIEYKYIVASPVLYESKPGSSEPKEWVWQAPLRDALKLPWVHPKKFCKTVKGAAPQPDVVICDPEKDPATGEKTDFSWMKLVDDDQNNIVGIYLTGFPVSSRGTYPSFSSLNPLLEGVMSLKNGDAGIWSPTLGVKPNVVNKINQTTLYQVPETAKAIGILSTTDEYINIQFGGLTKALPLVSLIQEGTGSLIEGDDTSKEHYNSYTRILDLMLYQTIKSYLL